MTRVWLVDDELPYDKLTPVPDRVEKIGMDHLIRTEAVWSENPAVRNLCVKLAGDADVEITALSAPAVLTKYLESGVDPPHVVIFDWEGLGFGTELNLATIEETLRSTFAYVQVYTHLDVGSVEPRLAGIRPKYQGRLLPAKSKQDVKADELFAAVKVEYEKTIAGEIADQARKRVRRSLEEALVELCSIPKTALADLAHQEPEILFSLVASKLRDGLASEGAEFVEGALSEAKAGESTDALRRFQSVWYYYFPTDQLVRRGDIARTPDGTMMLVVSAQCDLARFSKKTAMHLTFAPMLELTKANATALKDTCKVELKKIGGSPISSHDQFGHAFIVLPNVPSVIGDRNTLKDYFVRCHALQSKEMPRAGKEALKYSEVDGLVRVCTLAESFAAAVVAHLVATLAATGMPDFPEFEKARLQKLLS
jgi:hypothetical protein